MAVFFMYGRYSQDSAKKIEADRTKKAMEIAKEAGGEIKSIHATLGEHDLVFLTEFPDVEAAMKASLDLFKELGISFTTAPAVPVEKLDELV